MRRTIRDWFLYLLRWAIFIVLCLSFVGCGDNEPGDVMSGAAIAACNIPVGVAVTYQECGGKTSGGVYCVAGCTRDDGGPIENCTLPVYGPPGKTAVCVTDCSACQ